MNNQEIENLCSRYGMSHLMYMTHIGNIGSILQEGLLCYNLVNARRVAHTSVADPNIQRRRGKSLCTVDGNPTQIDIHEYVPLFVAKHTPMQYVITTSAPTKGRYAIVKNEDLAFILIDPIKVLQVSGMLIANGNAAANSTQFFTSPASLSEIDWDAISSPNEYPQCYDWEWKRCKSAEVLIPKYVPVDFIAGFAVCNDLAKSILIQSIVGSLGRDSEHDLLTQSIVIDTGYYMW